jgi:hypothetical protein
MRRSWPSILIACWIPVCATGATPLSSSQLREHCLAYQVAADSDGGQVCAAYIRGFLDGLGTDGRSRAPVIQAESWLDRARRTRLGSREARKPSFCLDETVTIGQIIGNLLVHAQSRPPQQDVPASALLRSALQRFHPCLDS